MRCNTRPWIDPGSGCAVEVLLDFTPGVLTDDDLVHAREVEQTRGGIDHVAGERELAVARIAASHHDQAGIDAAVHGQCATDACGHVGSDVADLPVQFGRRTHRAHDVVAARGRNAEQRHDFIANELVDDAAMAYDDDGYGPLDPIHDRLDLFGIEAFVQGGVAGEIGEQDGRVATLALVRTGDAMTAFRAELGRFRAQAMQFIAT